MESAGARTSRVTVFIVPPRYVSLKICDQLIRCGEAVDACFAAEVPVVAFANLIVVAKNAHTMHHMRQSVIVTVSRTSYGFWQLPQQGLPLPAQRAAVREVSAPAQASARRRISSLETTAVDFSEF